MRSASVSLLPPSAADAAAGVAKVRLLARSVAKGAFKLLYAAPPNLRSPRVPFISCSYTLPPSPPRVPPQRLGPCSFDLSGPPTCC